MIVLILKSRNARHSQSLKKKVLKEATGGTKEEIREVMIGAMDIVPDSEEEVIKTEDPEVDTEVATASSEVTEETIKIEMVELQEAGDAAKEVKYGPIETETTMMMTVMAMRSRAGVVTMIATIEGITVVVKVMMEVLTLVASQNDQMSDQKQQPRPQVLLDQMSK